MRLLRLLMVAAVLAGLAFALHAPAFVISDADGYYHLRHAWVYRQSGFGDSSFPWMQRSVLGTFGADLWYGFHVLISPFAVDADMLLGLRAASFAITVASLGLFYWALRNLGVMAPLLWTSILCCVSADLALRLTMLRPHSLSLMLSVAFFSAIVRRIREEARPARERAAVSAAIFAFLLAWIHLALAWAPVVILACVAFVSWLAGSRLPSRDVLLATIGGLASGALLRPRPIAGLQLAWLQLFGEVGPQRLGVEMHPLAAEVFCVQLVPLSLMVLLVGALGPRPTRRKESLGEDLARWSSLLIACCFLLLAFVAARRATEFFAVFAMVFVALGVTARVNRWRRKKILLSPGPLALGLTGCLILAAAALRTWPLLRHYQRVVERVMSPDRMRSASLWLAQNSPPGAVVFHVEWESFPHLFFWNPRSRYIHGMDPRFEHAYDPTLSHAHQLLVADDVYAFANEETRRPHGLRHTLRRTLTEDFGASWVVLEKRRSPRFAEVLRDVFGVAPAFEDDETVVFEIGAPPPDPAPVRDP